MLTLRNSVSPLAAVRDSQTVKDILGSQPAAAAFAAHRSHRHNTAGREQNLEGAPQHAGRELLFGNPSSEWLLPTVGHHPAVARGLHCL